MSDEYNGELIRIIVPVPKETVTCSFTVKMLVSGKLEDAHMEMTPEEFRQARKHFLDNVEDGDEYDAIYTLTEKGKAYADELFGGGADDNG